MTVGGMRHRLVLERRRQCSEAAQDDLPDWAAIAAVWGAIEPLSGAESLAADRLQSRVTHEIRLRYRTDITSAMRLRMGARVFHIVSVIDEEERRRFLVCRVEERTA